MHESIKEQEKAAKAGLEYLQVQANKDALEAECKGQSDEIAVAQAHFVESMCIMSRVPSGVVVSWHLTQPLLDAVHQRFAEVKEDSREKLRISREKLEECDDEIRGQFQQMEEVSRRARAVPVPLTHSYSSSSSYSYSSSWAGWGHHAQEHRGVGGRARHGPRGAQHEHGHERQRSRAVQQAQG